MTVILRIMAHVGLPGDAGPADGGTAKCDILVSLVGDNEVAAKGL